MLLKLSALRDEKNLSQKAVADLAGISQNHYSNIERGLRRASPEVAKKIAEVLGFSERWYLLLETK